MLEEFIQAYDEDFNSLSAEELFKIDECKPKIEYIEVFAGYNVDGSQRKQKEPRVTCARCNLFRFCTKARL